MSPPLSQQLPKVLQMAPLWLLYHHEFREGTVSSFVQLFHLVAIQQYLVLLTKTQKRWTYQEYFSFLASLTFTS